MAWPTVNIDTTEMDAGTDHPDVARIQIKQIADNVNAIKDAKGAASGIAPLDSGSKVPAANLPVIPANLGGHGQTAFTVGDILYASAAGVLSKLPAGTNNFVLKSNGPGNAPSWQAEGGGLVTGTRTVFQNSTAPTGWTKETDSAYNNVALRIVTGSVSTGGADNFDDVFGASKATAGHVLTIAQMPAHGHPVPDRGSGSFGSIFSYSQSYSYQSSSAFSSKTANSNGVFPQGGDGAHSHGLTLDLKYRDFIIAQKD